MKYKREGLLIVLQIVALIFLSLISAAQGAPPASAPAATVPQNGNVPDAKKDKKKPADKNTTSPTDIVSEEPDKDSCNSAEEIRYTDCRGVFFSSFYLGLAIDTFSGDEMLKYLNPGDTGKIHERAIGGIDFEYRLLGDHKPALKLRRDVSSAPANNESSTKKPAETATQGTKRAQEKKLDLPGNPLSPLQNFVGNPDPVEAMGIGHIAKRRGGEPCDPTKNEDCRNIDWHPRNLWVYGETLHGVRSVDVDCTKNPNLPVCTNAPTIPPNPGEQLYYLLRNATSLEGYFGFRWEFLGFQQKSSSPANLYLKGQAGFLNIAGAGGSALDMNHVALGAIATKGRYANSYLEVGYGRSDVFAAARRKRVKVDAYLQRNLNIKGMNALSVFVQMFIDTDLGRGPDAIQSFVGLNFDLAHLMNKRSEGATQPDSKEPKDQPKN